MIKSLARMGVTSKPRMILGTGSPPLPAPRPVLNRGLTGQRVGRNGRIVLPAGMPVPVQRHGRPPGHGPRLWGGVSGPRRAVEAGQWLRGAERGAGRVLMPAAPPPALRRSCQPPKGSPGGGAYPFRYRARGHVNGSGHGGLPAGVVPAVVLGVTVSRPAGRRKRASSTARPRSRRRPPGPTRCAPATTTGGGSIVLPGP
jgi:hypothetical protein